MTRDWSQYFFPLFVNVLGFLMPAIIAVFLYIKSNKDDKYNEELVRVIKKLVGVIKKFLTFGLIPITLILLFLMFATYNGFVTSIVTSMFNVFPIICLIWLVSAIVKYVKVRKTDNIDERKKLKKNLIAAVIVTSLEWIMFIFLIAVVLGVLRGMT